MTGKLDGHSIDNYEGRFGGSWEMEETVANQIAYDDVVTFLVVSTVNKANFKSEKNGELKRTNIFEVDDVSILSPQLAQEILAKTEEE